MRFVRAWILALFAGSLLQAAPAKTARQIIDELIKHSEDSAVTNAQNAFAYQRTSRVDYLDDDGRLKKQTVRVYEIHPENGLPVSRLISINGRPQDEDDNNGEKKKGRSAAREAGEKGRLLKISAELLNRFEFTLKGEDTVAGRSAWVLNFAPREDAPREDLVDKVISSIFGAMWVDQEDYQMAKVDLHLSKRVTFFAGIAGAIDRMDMQVIQKRLEPSVWFREAITLDFVGRKFLSPVRLRCFENCFDFKKSAAATVQASIAN